MAGLEGPKFGRFSVLNSQKLQTVTNNGDRAFAHLEFRSDLL